MIQTDPIKTTRYLNELEIAKNLDNVEYILMATPAPEQFKKSPIHFTIFLNTTENLPQEIQTAVFEKFLHENSITNPQEVMSQLMPVGFGESLQDTSMPMLLIRPEDQRTIPHRLMFVIDFLADSDNFAEAKIDNLTGWSYSYNE